MTGRLTGHSSDLGAFTLGYLGQTGQTTSRQRASSTLATSWTYLNNAGDRRLAGVANTGLTAGHFSNFTFTSTPEDFVAGVTETSDASAVYPSALTQTGTYNNLNQLTVLSGQALAWDTVGNLTSDGPRTYTWDAENRLVGIGYPGQPGKATAFAYDGLGRRVSITETPPGGGTPVTTNYLWCGDTLCQARDGSNATTRSYYDEGEFVSGAPGQPYYYGIDQLGSVRRAFASTSSAPAFNYDPYGAALAGPAPVTDFGFAGLFNHAASGLNLTLYRAYDPVAGRWLSRDPIGEIGDPSSNLYPYVANNTPNAIDPLGLVGTPGPPDPVQNGARFCEDVSWDQAANSPYLIMQEAECFLAGAGGCNPFKKGGGGGSKSKKKPPSAPKEPPLKRLHPDSTTMESNKSGYDYWSKQTNEKIVDSLKPGSKEALRVKPDGTVANGNTRIKVLQERGFDVNSLPRERYP